MCSLVKCIIDSKHLTKSYSVIEIVHIIRIFLLGLKNKRRQVPDKCFLRQGPVRVIFTPFRRFVKHELLLNASEVVAHCCCFVYL